MTGRIRIAVIDDHLTIHQAIGAAIEAFEDLELVGHGSNGREALQLCADEHPDIVLMDIVMPGMDGIEATRAIHEQYPHIKVLALSSFQDEEGVRAMLHAGAVGYIVKTASVDDLAAIIRAAHAGKSVFSPEIMQILLREPQTQPTRDFRLTARELEILKLLADGLNNSEIAEMLTISLSTVKFHVRRIFAKLGVTNRVEAVTLAIAEKLVTR